MMWHSSLRKYKEIVLAAALFVALDAGVLVLNFYTSYQIADDAHAIQLAARQSMLSQRIAQSIYRVRDDLEQGEKIDRAVISLAIPFKQFDEVLDSFIYGGELIGAGLGQDNLLKDSNYAQTNANLLSQAQMLWQPYRRLITPIVYAGYDDDVDRDQLLSQVRKAIDYNYRHGDQLLELMQDFAVAVEDVANRKAQTLRKVQTVGICLAVINFLLILFHFLRKLGRSDQRVEAARRETDEILNTVNEGLFLLGADQCIGSQYSASMETLFQRRDLARLPLLDLLAPLLSEATLATAEDFINLLFNPRVKSDLMSDLNPLREVEINLTNIDGSFSSRYFSFEFSRVFDCGELLHLLVTVTDVTELVELRQKLKQSEQKSSREMELLLSLIHIEPSVLNNCLDSFERIAVQINQELEAPVLVNGDYRKKIDRIHRMTHKLKGDCTVLDLHLLEDRIDQLEESLQILRASRNVNGNDFLPLVVKLNELTQMVHSIRAMIGRLGHVTSTGASMDTEADWGEQLQKVAAQVAEDCHKQVYLDLKEFNQQLIPEYASEASRDALIQFIRNAIVHGLEDTAHRLERGKPERGRVSVKTRLDSGRVVLEVKDDGSGIDFNRVRRRLVEMQHYSESEAAALTPAKLVRWLFSPGFSTASTKQRHAGRGVGLDLVKESLGKLGAKLSVTSKAGVHTCFTIRFFEQQLELAESA